MIISASRRTDIPAYYMTWFLNRMREGYVLARNPMNLRQVSRILLTPEAVEGIVFWSKAPGPLLEALPKLPEPPFYLQYTLNGYGQDVEPALPDLERRITLFQTLAERLGSARVRWRYDPILLNARYTPQAHYDTFANIARRLRGYSESVTISFLDRYAKIENNLRALGVIWPDSIQIRDIAGALAQIARENGMTTESCAETADLSGLGIVPARCVDDRLLSRISGITLQVGHDSNQRPACGCALSVDIGAYNCCANGCRYCYANFSNQTVMANQARHNPDAPLLIGMLKHGDIVRDKKCR